jgi:hypothetical protein
MASSRRRLCGEDRGNPTRCLSHAWHPPTSGQPSTGRGKGASPAFPPDPEWTARRRSRRPSRSRSPSWWRGRAGQLAAEAGGLTQRPPATAKSVVWMIPADPYGRCSGLGALAARALRGRRDCDGRRRKSRLPPSADFADLSLSCRVPFPHRVTTSKDKETATQQQPGTRLRNRREGRHRTNLSGQIAPSYVIDNKRSIMPRCRPRRSYNLCSD